MRAEVLEGLPGLACCRDDWLRLHAAVPQAGYHLEHGAVHAMLACLAPDPSAQRIVRVFDGEVCVALLRVAPRERRMLRTLRIRALEVTGLAECPHQDVLLAPGADAAAVWRAVTAALRQHGIRWDALASMAVPRGAGLHRLASASKAHARCVAATGVVAGASQFDTRRAHADLAARFTPMLARNLAKGWRRIERAGHWEIDSVRGTAAASTAFDAFDAFCRVEASGWKGAAGTGSAAALNPCAAAYFRRLFMLDRGAACHGEVNLLRLDGQAIAAQLCVVSGGTRFVVKIGFDEAHARLGPGQLLIDEMLRRSCADPLVHTLSLVTHQPWHADWQPETLPVDDLMLLRNPLLAIGWHAFDALRRRAVPGLSIFRARPRR